MKRPNSPLLIPLVLVSMTSTSWCQDVPKEDTRQPELIAKLDYSPGYGFLYSRAPRVSVYQNGDVIFARHEKSPDAQYFLAKLKTKDLAELARAIAEAHPEMKKNLNLTPGVTHQPVVMLTLVHEGKSKSCWVEGYGSKVKEFPKDMTPDELPAALARVIKSLLAIEVKDAKQWTPEWIEIHVTSTLYEEREEVPKWPDEWPAIGSQSAVPVESSKDSYSIIIPARDLERFMALERKGNGQFRSGENKWTAYHWRPLTPGTDRWNQFQKSSSK